MFSRYEWASLFGIYVLGAFLYALLLTPGFMLAGLAGGFGFMFIGLIFGFCGALIGRRSNKTMAGIIVGYLVFTALVTTDFWLPGAA